MRRSDSSLRQRLLGRPDAHGASGQRDFWALQDVSFDIAPGEVVGLIGRNGAGKSTLLKVLSRITAPTSGNAVVTGRVASLLEVGTGFHPELTGRENIFLNGAILGMGRRETSRRLDEIVDFAGVDRFLDTPVKRYSSGMYLRLAFAVAAHLDTELLFVDEVLAVGDAQFQRKCMGRMEQLSGAGRTVVFVSHSMPSVTRLCQRLILLADGRVRADGPTADVVHVYVDAGAGSSAERVWDNGTGPGDDVVRLVSVRCLDDTGPASEFDIRSPVDVEITYEQRSDDPAARPSALVKVVNEDGIVLFVSHDFVNKEWQARSRRPGVVTAVCTIPGNYLAEGTHLVTAAIASHDPETVHAEEPDAVTFTVVDRSEGDGVRGDYNRDWPGVVRPMLAWSVSARPTSAIDL